MMRSARLAAAVSIAVAATISLAWIGYAYYIAAVAIEGENCTDADRATCTDAAPVYGAAQAVLCLIGIALVVRAVPRAGRAAATGGEAVLRAMLPPALAFGGWLALVGIRIATSGHPW